MEEFAEWYLNENKINSLYLVLALINMYGKGDSKRAKEDFNSFFEYCRINEIKLADSTIDDLKKKIQAGLS